MKKTYHYMVIELTGIPEDDAGTLDALGRGEYELVAVVQVPGSGSQKPKLLAYLMYAEQWEKIPGM
jgi:hypothetical protein